jgi:peptidyl-prolyl cis-trans isomerase B (cyclophilin B)
VVTKKKRRRQLARQKWERQQARRALRRQRARRRAIIASAVAGVLAVGAGGYGIFALVSDDSPASASPTPTSTPARSPSPSASRSASASPSPSSTPTATAAAAAAPRPTKPGECVYVPYDGPNQKSFGLPASSAPRTDAVATITTNRGTITVDLLGEDASCAVHSFTFLANKGAFDNTPCTGLAVEPARARYLECGDVTGSGDGGPGYVFGNENDDRRQYDAGWLVLADGENRNGSRFYITYGESSRFDHRVTAFGKVRTGLDVVREVARGGLAPGSDDNGVGRPATSIVIKDVKVTTK